MTYPLCYGAPQLGSKFVTDGQTDKFFGVREFFLSVNFFSVLYVFLTPPPLPGVP